MARSRPGREVVAWVLRRIGPPPPAPRRRFAAYAQGRATHVAAGQRPRVRS